MKVRELVEKLQEIEEKYADGSTFDVYIDAGDINLLEINTVYAGSAWNVVISPEEIDEED